MLAARHRARLAMQDGNADSREDFPARILRNPKVKRKLFADDEGSDNSGNRGGLNDNESNEFMEEIRRHQEEARKKYNFNFATEQPETGNYVWEKVNDNANGAPEVETNEATETESHQNQENNQEIGEPND